MKRLYLLRHAAAGPTEKAADDRDRPLSARGRFECLAVTRYMHANSIRPAGVLSSTALRARETVAAIAGALGPDVEPRFDSDLYLAAPGTVLAAVQAAEDSLPSLLVVGHNPGLSSLALALIGAGPPDLKARLAAGLPPAGLATLALDADTWRSAEVRAFTLEDYGIPAEIP